MYPGTVAPRPLRNPKPEITREDRVLIKDEPYLLSSKFPGGFSFNHAEEPERSLDLTCDQINRLLETGNARILEGAENPITEITYLARNPAH